MSENIQSHESLFINQPLSIDQLTPQSASQGLFDLYTNRIAELPGFRQRSFHEARDDFESSIIEADDSADIGFVRMLLHRLVDENGYDSFLTDTATYWEHYQLEADLENYSYVYLTNHRVFSDLPIIAGATRDVRQHDPYAATRNHMVVGKLIPGMEVDMFGDESYAPVTGLLKMVARQLQSVPKIPDSSHDSIKAQRTVWNEEFKRIFQSIISQPGNILFVAASGSQDLISNDKKSLTMQSVNPETAAMLCHPRLKVIPLFFSCPSFDANGLVPAQPRYKYLKPRILETTDEVFDLMEEFSVIGSDLLSDEFPKGVSYDRSISDRLRHMAAEILRRNNAKQQF